MLNDAFYLWILYINVNIVLILSWFVTMGGSSDHPVTPTRKTMDSPMHPGGSLFTTMHLQTLKRCKLLMMS